LFSTCSTLSGAISPSPTTPSASSATFREDKLACARGYGLRERAEGTRPFRDYALARVRHLAYLT
jgi:hypothetical protein